jgi:hypothetical protein
MSNQDIMHMVRYFITLLGYLRMMYRKVSRQGICGSLCLSAASPGMIGHYEVLKDKLHRNAHFRTDCVSPDCLLALALLLILSWRTCSGCFLFILAAAESSVG